MWPLLPRPYGERMEAEDPRQHADGLLVAGGDVYPDESILALEQRLELLDGTLLNALRRCSTPSSDTKRTSIPLATFQTKVGCA